MKEEKQTRENLLASAQQEFMEKGYYQASLRSICKKAGVTTGALYFFFQDKEDLFAAIVKEPIERLYEYIKSHYEEEITVDLAAKDMRDDIAMSRQLLTYLYDYRDVFMLLLTKAQGSKYEHILDELIALSDAHYRKLADLFAAKYQTRNMSDYTVHWFSHLQIDTFARFLEHGLTREEAEEQLEILVTFMYQGWCNYFLR